MERTLRTTVRFEHPFELAGAEGLQPAGVYEIETTELGLDGLSFVASRRLTTTITLHRSARYDRQMIEIDPQDLARAIEKDRADTTSPPHVI